MKHKMCKSSHRRVKCPARNNQRHSEWRGALCNCRYQYCDSSNPDSVNATRLACLVPEDESLWKRNDIAPDPCDNKPSNWSAVLLMSFGFLRIQHSAINTQQSSVH